MNRLPIAIIGAGPVGLAAAAQLAIRKESFIILEAGETVASNILTWGHIRLFSPWEYNIDRAAKKLLRETDWKEPDPTTLPTGKELVDLYLKPLSQLPEIAPFLSLNSKVISVSKKGIDKMKSKNRDESPFVIYMERAGQIERIEARSVIDASGTWHNPNPVNSDSIWTRPEIDANEKIHYGIPDISGENRERFTNKRFAVIGGGHSAVNTLLELAQQTTAELYWILRKHTVSEAYGGEEKDALQARGELGSKIHALVDQGIVKVLTPYKIHSVKLETDGLLLEGDYLGQEYELMVDEVICNTGSRPDFSFLREVRLSIDPATESVEALAPLIDPNIHSCGTVRPHGEEILRQPEKNFYIVGMKSYGRAPTFLMATGFEQVRSVVSFLTGDIEASKKVELKLPETGVCSINLTNNYTECCSPTC